MLCFKDVAPVAETHLLLIPKVKDGLSGISKAEDKHVEVLGKMMTKIPKIAEEANLQKGYRVVINEGMHGCQSVFHLHIHIIGGEQLSWPPGVPDKI